MSSLSCRSAMRASGRTAMRVRGIHVDISPWLAYAVPHAGDAFPRGEA
jgi:hypothetical protein